MQGLGEQVGEISKPNHVLRLLAVCGVIAVCALAWRTGPLRTWADPANVSVQLDRFAAEPWAPLAMLAIFIVAGLVFFPLLVLISATALVFEPWRALPIAMCGALASTTLLYGIGVLAGRRSQGGARLRAMRPIAALLRGRDVFAVVVIRMLPIAPFTVVSVSFGLLGLPLRVVLLGTALGLTPGMLAITAFGAQLRQVIANPTAPGVALLIGLGLAWLGIAMLLQRLASSRARKRLSEAPPPA